MEKMKGYHPADWGPSPSVIENAAGKGLFKMVDLEWSKPVLLPKNGDVPKFSQNNPIVYVILRDHGKLKQTENIRYVGLTQRPKGRFEDHQVIKDLARKRGQVRFSYAVINIKGKNKMARTKDTLEELEHILIWALWAFGHVLDNKKKQNILPGLGLNGGGAWQVKSTGYRFKGRMPLEIVFPWMLLKVGRDRSTINRE